MVGSSPSRRGVHAALGRPPMAFGERRPRQRGLVAGSVAVALLAVGGAAIAFAAGSGGSGGSATSPRTAAGHQPGGSGAAAGHQLTSQQGPPLRVITTSPAAGGAPVASDGVVTVSFSAPVDSSAATPSLFPPVSGKWALASPTQWQFTPSSALVPGSKEVLTVPGGSNGVAGRRGERLAQSEQVTFSVAPGSTLRLQELLAQLGYLPLSFQPSAPVSDPRQEADPQNGTFAWRWATTQSQLASSWSEGAANTITKGAVMDFEEQHGLGVDGSAGPQVWGALLQDVAAGHADPHPYNNVWVSTTLPESVTVFSNGVPVYSSPANTGVPGADTAAGTYPVYQRFVTTTMSGTNVDGSHYVDPGIPWVSYFNGGDALHGYVRSSYGTPQSNGCVEMPVANAQAVWPMTPLGTLVTVE